VEARTGTEIWADRFDRPASDVFAVQDDIVQKIVTTLNLQVSLSERGILTRQTTDNLEAYDDFLRGLAYSWRETKEDNAKALQLYQKAIELDPKYADAYVMLSVTELDDWDWQWSPDSDALERSLAFVQKALALDDSHSSAHVILGRILAEQRQFDAAIAETDRGIALAPNNAASNYFCSASGDKDWAAETLNRSGKPAEALEIAREATRRDPRNRDFHLMEIGIAYYNLGRSHEAIPVLERFINSYPGFIDSRYVLAAAYVESGMMQQAHAETAEIKRVSPEFSLEAGLFKGAKQSDRLISDLRKAGLK
jgi:adenylate cyclase